MILFLSEGILFCGRVRSRLLSLDQVQSHNIDYRALGDFTGELVWILDIMIEWHLCL